MKNTIPSIFLALMLFGAVRPAAAQNVTFDSLRTALVVVETDTGSGSGFVIEMHGKRYVMTNYHVIRNSRKMLLRLIDGQKIQPMSLELADTVDLARIQFDEAKTQTTALKPISQDPTINDAVQIYGNSEGQGAVTELKGRILGVGPDTVEVDATFVSGNSGSPIISADDGSVLGVATYATSDKLGKDWVSAGTRFDQVRRFGVRISPNIEWVPVSPIVLQQQTELLGNVFRHLVSVYTIVRCWDSHANRTETRSAFIAYASNQKTTVFKPTPWDGDTRYFTSAYKEYWGYQDNTKRHGRGINVSPMTSSLQLARKKMLRTFIDLPTKPSKSIESTRWVTKRLASEAEEQKQNIAFVEEAVKFVVKEESAFWSDNVLRNTSNPYR